MDIMKKVSSAWWKIGIYTGQENSLEGIRRQATGYSDETRCCHVVFQRWIDEGGHPPKYPLTWVGLRDLLCDVGHRRTANAMARQKRIPTRRK
jgi:hypothetical protein